MINITPLSTDIIAVTMAAYNNVMLLVISQNKANTNVPTDPNTPAIIQAIEMLSFVFVIF